MEVAQDFLECSMGRAKPSPSVDSNEDSLPRFAGSSLTDATPSVSSPPHHTNANEQQQQQHQRQGSVGALRQSMTTVNAPSSGLGARSGSHVGEGKGGGAGASVIGSSLTFATFSKVDEDDPHGNNSFALSRQQTQRRQTSFAAQPRKSMVSKSFRPKMDDKSTQVTTAMHFLSSERGIALQELGARAVEHIYEAHRRKEDYLLQKESVLLENIPEVEEQEGGGEMPPSREVVALVMRDASDDDGSDADDGPIQDALRAGCSEDECMALRAVHNRLRQFSTLMACFLEKVSNAPRAAAEHASAIREFTKSWVGEPPGVLPKAMHKAFEAARADEEVLVTAIRQDLESALRSTTTSQEQRVEKLQDAAGRQKALLLRRVQREEHRAELLREGQDRLLHLWNERSIDDDAVENDLALRSEALVESCRAILGKLFLYIAKAVEPTSAGTGVGKGESNAGVARTSSISAPTAAPLRSPFVLNGTFLGGERQRTSLGLLPSRPGITLHEALQQHRKQQLHAEAELPQDEPEGGIPLITEDALVRSYLQSYPDTLEHVAIPRDFELLRRMANEEELQELLRLREIPEEQWFFGTDELTYLRELFLKRYAAEEKRRIDEEMQSRRAEGSRKLTMELRQVAEQAKAAAKLKGLAASTVGTNSAATGMRQSHSLRDHKGAGGGSSSMIMGGSASNPPILQSIAQTTSEGSSALERSLPMPPLAQGLGSGEGAAAALGVDLFSHNPTSSITPRQPVFKALSSPGGTVLSGPTHTLVSPPPALATEDSLKWLPPPLSNEEGEGKGETGTLSTTSAAPTTDPKLLLKTQTAVALKGAEDAVHRVVEELHRVTANESPSADVLTQDQKKASVRVNGRRSPPKASGCGSPVGGCITISGGQGGAAVTLDAAIGGTHTFLFQPPQTVAAATLSPSAADPARVDITIDVHPAGTSSTTIDPPPPIGTATAAALTKSSGKVRSAPPLGSHSNNNSNKNVLRPIVSHPAQLSAATVGVNGPPQPQQQRATSSSSAIKPSLTKGRSTSHLLLPSTTAEEIVMQRRHHHLHHGSSTMPAAAGGRAPPLPPHPSSAQYRSEEAALLQQATQLAMRSSSPAQGPLPTQPLVVESDDNESPSQLAQRLMVESMIYARSTRNLPGGATTAPGGVEPTVTIPTGALPRPHNNNNNNNMHLPEHQPNGVVAPPSVSLMTRNKRYEQLTKPVTRHVPASVNSLTEQRYRSHNTLVAHQELGESDVGLDRVAPLPSFAGSRRSTPASGASRTGGAGGPSFSQFVADRRAMTSAPQQHQHHPQHSAMDFFGGPAGEFASQIEHARDEEEPSFFTLPLDGVGDHFPLFAPQPHVALAPLPQRNTPVMCRPTSLAMGAGGASSQQRVLPNDARGRHHNQVPGMEEGMEDGEVSRIRRETSDVVHHMVAVDARATAAAVAKPQFAYLMP